MLNNVSIMGRLVSDPELKKTQNDVSVTSFTIAVERSGSKDKETDFIDIVAWRSTADFICKYFNKGKMIAIEGAIRTRTYEDKNGNKRKSVEIFADQVHFCGGKSDNTEKPDYMQSNYMPQQQTIEDDDLPF